jgi:hypothetical protein
MEALARFVPGGFQGQKYPHYFIYKKKLVGQGVSLTLYARPGEGSAWTHAGLDNLWQPDTHVLNAKKLSRPETVTHIRATGIVKSRTRLSLTASCPMDLRWVA